VAARSSVSCPDLDSEDPAVTFDPRLRDLVDHLAVDLAHEFGSVPQAGVPAPIGRPLNPRKER